MTVASPASLIAISKGAAYTSRSSRSPTWAGAQFRPPSDPE